MRGYSHALSGAAAWLALTSGSVASSGLLSAPALINHEVCLIGGLLCAGAALAPDADHPSGTIAHAIPSIKVCGVTVIPSPSRLVCKVIATISGGHRHATHSIFGIGVFTLLSQLASILTFKWSEVAIPVGSAIISFFLTAFAVKALGISKSIGNGGRKSGLMGRFTSKVLHSWVGPWMLSVGVTALALWRFGDQWSWLFAVGGIGCLAHCIGDSLTVEKVPWLWPLNPRPPRFLRRNPKVHKIVGFFWGDNGYFGIPILGSTGSRRERVLAFAMLLYVSYVVTFEATQILGFTVLP